MSVVWPSVGSIPQVVWLPMFDNRANTSVRTFRPGAGRKSYRVTREAVYPTAHSWPGPVWPCCQGLHPPRNRQRDLFPPRPASRPRENYRGSVGGSPRKTTNTLRVVAPDGSAPPPQCPGCYKPHRLRFKLLEIHEMCFNLISFFYGFETGSYYVVLAVQELTIYARLASYSETHIPLTPESWD